VRQRLGPGDSFAAVRSNPPLLRLWAAFLPFNVVTGLCSGVSYLYLDTYLGLSRQFPVIAMTGLLATLLGVPFWSALSARYERHRVWALCLACGGLGFTALALVKPGPSAAALSFALYPLVFFSIGGAVLVAAMSADIVDYGRLHTGEDHGGLYGALFAFLQKSVFGVAAAAGVALVGAFGFDATAAAQSAGGAFGITLAFAILPASGLIGAAAIIWNYPLDKARVADIQAALAERGRQPPN